MSSLRYLLRTKEDFDKKFLYREKPERKKGIFFQASDLPASPAAGVHSPATEKDRTREIALSCASQGRGAKRSTSGDSEAAP